MKSITKKLYEAMFLVDSSKAAGDWEGVNAAITNMLEKTDAEIVSLKKWDERKLAYEIERAGRGTYILCYFRAGGESIKEIERSVQLSEYTMRVLILCAETRAEEILRSESELAEAEKEKNAEAAKVEAKEEEVAAVEQVETKEEEVAEVEEVEKEEQKAEETEDVSSRKDGEEQES